MATEESLASRVLEAVRPRTRVVALTWVHSSTGLKLPTRRIASGLARLNAHREPAERALPCVDGVHALGVEDLKEGLAALPEEVERALEAVRALG